MSRSREGKIVHTHFADKSIKLVDKYNIQTSDLTRKIRNAWMAFGRLIYVFGSRTMKFTTKMKIQQCVVLMLMFGTETWAIMTKKSHKFQVIQWSVERIIANIWLKTRRSIKCITERTTIEELSLTIMETYGDGLGISEWHKMCQENNAVEVLERK